MWRRTGPEEFRRGLLPYLWGRTTRSSLAWLSKLASVMLFHATRPAHSMGECARFSLYFERDDRFKTRKGGCSIPRLAGESCFRVSSTDSCIAWIRLPTPLSEKEKGKILLGFFPDNDAISSPQRRFPENSDFLSLSNRKSFWANVRYEYETIIFVR